MNSNEKSSQDAPPSYNEAVEGTSPPALNEKNNAPSSSTPQTSAWKPSPTIPLIPPGPLNFSIHIHKPFLGTQTITISPSVPFGPVSHYRLSFSRPSAPATLTRHGLPPQDRLTPRTIAEIIYPGELQHPYGIILKFKPSEAEGERRGERHATDTDRMMLVDGYLTTRYSIDWPLGGPLAGKTVEWRVLPVQKKNEISSPGEKRGSVDEKAKSRPWTPFSTQTLVEAGYTSKAIATFSHSAPFAKETGILTIPQIDGIMTPEYVEAIVIVTAAMVGFQDKAGLTSLLIESGWESMVLKGKNKA